MLLLVVFVTVRFISGHSIIIVMQSLPANIYSVASVREMDRIAIEEQGIEGYTLMQRAAAAALSVAQRAFPDARCWQIVCGAGNNGGDGYVLAQLAAREGIKVSVISLVDPGSLDGDAARAHADYRSSGGAVSAWGGELDIDAELLVDAMLGSGLVRDVGGAFAAAVDRMNDHPAPVHALDIATGINGDTGAVMGAAVRADITTTFVGLKAGLFLGEGPNHCGRITFAGLGIDETARVDLPVLYKRILPEAIAGCLPPRARAAHKGDFGHVLVVGGGPGMPGAALLCGEAALRTGAGKVTIATHPGHAAAIAARRPELMCRGVATSDELRGLVNSVDVIAIGPGLGQSEWAEEVLSAVAMDRRPAVWDADALNRLAKQADKQSARIITPHPGEAGRLLARPAADIQADRLHALAGLQETYGGIAVLKGAGTLVSSASGAPWLSTSGNPGMAAPGMGDVLTGVIAALLAQGLAPETAAAIGVEVHARAGDIAAMDGERGMLASDVIRALRQVVNP